MFSVAFFFMPLSLELTSLPLAIVPKLTLPFFTAIMTLLTPCIQRIAGYVLAIIASGMSGRNGKAR